MTEIKGFGWKLIDKWLKIVFFLWKLFEESLKIEVFHWKQQEKWLKLRFSLKIHCKMTENMASIWKFGQKWDFQNQKHDFESENDWKLIDKWLKIGFWLETDRKNDWK